MVNMRVFCRRVTCRPGRRCSELTRFCVSGPTELTDPGQLGTSRRPRDDRPTGGSATVGMAGQNVVHHRLRRGFGLPAEQVRCRTGRRGRVNGRNACDMSTVYRADPIRTILSPGNGGTGSTRVNPGRPAERPGEAPTVRQSVATVTANRRRRLGDIAPRPRRRRDVAPVRPAVTSTERFQVQLCAGLSVRPTRAGGDGLSSRSVVTGRHGGSRRVRAQLRGVWWARPSRWLSRSSVARTSPAARWDGRWGRSSRSARVVSR
jgi:hypothetical protein